MGQNQFQFKQFRIIQDRCAMKVGTDGVLLGAWTNLNGVRSILDIGTGTGLIALMLAQRCSAEIDAVEMDLETCIQARENVAQSPWWHRIKVYHCSIQDYSLSSDQLYDLLVSNPPFFTNVSKSINLHRDLARHDDYLTPFDLLKAADRLLKKEGRMTIIYPYAARNKLKGFIKNFGFFCNQIVYVKPTVQSPVKRILIEVSRQPSCTTEQHLTIQTSRHRYTAEFINLIRDFYLKY